MMDLSFFHKLSRIFRLLYMSSGIPVFLPIKTSSLKTAVDYLGRGLRGKASINEAGVELKMSTRAFFAYRAKVW